MIEGNIVQKNKIIWLSILQGWSMLLVVIGHISLSNEFQDPQYPISSFIEKVIYSFHMPLFMFISGMLLYLYSRMRLKWTLKKIVLYCVEF